MRRVGRAGPIRARVGGTTRKPAPKRPVMKRVGTARAAVAKKPAAKRPTAKRVGKTPAKRTSRPQIARGRKSRTSTRSYWGK